MEKVFYRASQLREDRHSIWIMTTSMTSDEIRPSYLPIMQNILKCFTLQNATVKTHVVHFDSKRWRTEHRREIQEFDEQLHKEFPHHSYESVFAGIFPHNEAELSEVTGRLCGEPLKLSDLHILIDAAHLIEYALDGIKGTYVNYDHDMLRRIFYIYLGYHRFCDSMLIPEYPMIRLKNLASTFDPDPAWTIDKASTPMWIPGRSRETPVNHDNIACWSQLG